MHETTRASTHTIGDYAYDALYVGGIGGGLVALFILLWDVVTRGESQPAAGHQVAAAPRS